MVSDRPSSSIDQTPVLPGGTDVRPLKDGEGVGRQSLELGYEVSGVSVKGLAIFFVIFLVSGVLIHIVVWFLDLHLLGLQQTPLPPRSAVTPADRISDPPLQPSEPHDTTPEDDLIALRKNEDGIFRHMGWKIGARDGVEVPAEITQELAHRRGRPATGPATNAYEIPYTPATQPLGVSPAFSRETRLTPVPYAPSRFQGTTQSSQPAGGD